MWSCCTDRIYIWLRSDFSANLTTSKYGLVSCDHSLSLTPKVFQNCNNWLIENDSATIQQPCILQFLYIEKFLLFYIIVNWISLGFGVFVKQFSSYSTWLFAKICAFKYSQIKYFCAVAVISRSTELMIWIFDDSSFSNVRICCFSLS